MRTLDEILEMARKLPAEDRQRLLDELEAIGEESPVPPSDGPYSALLAIAGTIHSEYKDLSTGKYEHLAAALEEQKGLEA